MKVLLYYFSGTGNTALCASYLKKHFEELGDEVTCYPVTHNNSDAPNPNDFDVVGVGYPIHAFNAPEILVKFLKSLPNVDNKKLFFFKVSGEPFSPNNSSSYHPYRFLRKKGFKLVNEKHFLMPYNIMFKYPDDLQKQMYLYLDPLAKVFAIKVHNGEDVKVKYHLPSKIVSFFLRIEWIAPKVNCLFLHSKKKKCTKCMKCVNNCPAKAMYVNKKGTIKTRHTCTLCMRCSLNCPVNAINMGILNPWVVSGGFHYQTLNKKEELPGTYVNFLTKGYFRLFRKYFYKQNLLLKEYNIDIPVVYTEENSLDHMGK